MERRGTIKSKSILDLLIDPIQRRGAKGHGANEAAHYINDSQDSWNLSKDDSPGPTWVEAYSQTQCSMVYHSGGMKAGALPMWQECGLSAKPMHVVNTGKRAMKRSLR